MEITRVGDAPVLNTNESNADGAPPEIPPELHGAIIELVIKSYDLASLCLVSKAFQYTAERLLYASIGQITIGQDAKRYHTLFLTTINANDRLAALVREYRNLSIVERNRFPLWYLLKSGLRKMVNLKHFEYREMRGKSSGKLRDVSFKLDTLAWASNDDEKYMRKTLSRGQNGLKTLCYRHCRPGTSFPSKACPNLKTLCGSREVIEALLSGRQVEKFSIDYWGDEGYIDLTEGLQEALSRVRKLTMRGNFWRTPAFFPYISSIEVIGIKEEFFHEKVREAIQRLKTLRILIIPIIRKDSDEVITSLFNELPLHSIYTKFSVGHERPILYNQWRRNTSDATSPLKVGVVEDALRTFFTFYL